MCIEWGGGKMGSSINAIILCSILMTLDSEALVNLARGRPANMSSTYGLSAAGKAVDGNTSQVFASGSCSSTDPFINHSVAWWRVDLGREMNIQTIKIYYRNEKTLFRFSKFQVFVTSNDVLTSSTPCYKDESAVTPSFVNVDSCSGTGRYVTVFKSKPACSPPIVNINFCATLELCEVEVLGCDQGFYGPHCEQECQNCIEHECNPIDGNCTRGCKTGWTGDFCQSKVKCNISKIYIVNTEVVDVVQFEVEMNESVTMKCKTGFNHTDGDKIRTCTENGTWDGEPLNCSMCTCPCRNPFLPNYTDALAAWEKKMREELTWNPKNTSKFKRTKISANDNRSLSKTIGVTLGIGVLSFVAAIIFLPDIPRIARDFGCKKQRYA